MMAEFVRSHDEQGLIHLSQKGHIAAGGVNLSEAASKEE